LFKLNSKKTYKEVIKYLNDSGDNLENLITTSLVERGATQDISNRTLIELKRGFNNLKRNAIILLSLIGSLLLTINILNNSRSKEIKNTEPISTVIKDSSDEIKEKLSKNNKPTKNPTSTIKTTSNSSKDKTPKQPTISSKPQPEKTHDSKRKQVKATKSQKTEQFHIKSNNNQDEDNTNTTVPIQDIQ
jgi:hypothetical protein